jgi:hypothetical protein
VAASHRSSSHLRAAGRLGRATRWSCRAARRASTTRALRLREVRNLSCRCHPRLITAADPGGFLTALVEHVSRCDRSNPGARTSRERALPRGVLDLDGESFGLGLSSLPASANAHAARSAEFRGTFPETLAQPCLTSRFLAEVRRNFPEQSRRVDP